MTAVRLACCVLLAFAVIAPGAAHAGCAVKIGKLMSRDTERLNTRYHRVSERIEREGRNPKLAAESCRIVRALEPRLLEQIAALKGSRCSQDPELGVVVADIVRGHEADLASVRKTASAMCK